MCVCVCLAWTRLQNTLSWLYSIAMSSYYGYSLIRSLPSRSVAGVRKLEEDLELVPLLTVVTFVSLQVGDRVVRGLVSRLRSHPDIQTLVYWVSVRDESGSIGPTVVKRIDVVGVMSPRLLEPSFTTRPELEPGPIGRIVAGVEA